jgi:ATP-dependent Clp protease ATP-binding subunit ClpA
VRRCRTGALLLDEIEKAHPRILTQAALPLIGDGVLHDMNNGRALDVTNLMIVMTSNLGTNRPDEQPAGFAQAPGDERQARIRAIRAHFPKEVLGRVDDVIVFAPLSPGAIRQIWRVETQRLAAQLARRERPCRLSIDPETSSTRHNSRTGKLAFSTAMNANLTRSPWRRRPPLS